MLALVDQLCLKIVPVSQGRLVRYGWLLAMASKSGGCAQFLPNTESESYIERDSQKAKDKERESERVNKLQRERERERERKRESVREQNRVSKSDCHHCDRKRERQGGPE